MVQNGGSAGVRWSQKLSVVQNGGFTGVHRSVPDWSPLDFQVECGVKKGGPPECAGLESAGVKS